MIRFRCRCGQWLYFENTHCGHCGNTVGFDPRQRQLLSLQAAGDGCSWLDHHGNAFHLCQNQLDFNLCNWLVPASSGDQYCLACSMNQMIPSLSAPGNRRWWARMEMAKRRLLYSLLSLGLPVTSRVQDPARGLAFAFLEDRHSNPTVEEDYVLTGHAEGLITVNLREADSVSREWQRQLAGEAYRTLLGHFRHESGHYYFDRLVRNSQWEQPFIALFGDFHQDYQQALDSYHQQRATLVKGDAYISLYAQSHPFEDWAECWAHYLHMSDVLETAVDFGLVANHTLNNSFEQRVEQWIEVAVALNGLNRSMGLEDAYPFVLSSQVIEKLAFVHRVIGASTVA